MERAVLCGVAGRSVARFRGAGLESVPFDIEEYQRIRDVLMVSTAALGEQGLFSPDLFEEMLRYAEEYRDQSTAESRSTP